MYENEQWTAALIPELPAFAGHYEVSSLGRVRRVLAGKGTRMGRMLKPCRIHGYPSFKMCVNGRMIMRQAHRLMLLSFVGPCPEGHEACHNDGQRPNCTLSNLRWDTQSANQMDRVRHGTSNRGERHGLAKLTTADVIDILRMKRDGRTYAEIGRHHQISRSTACDIVKRRRWQHVEVA